MAGPISAFRGMRSSSELFSPRTPTTLRAAFRSVRSNSELLSPRSAKGRRTSRRSQGSAGSGGEVASTSWRSEEDRPTMQPVKILNIEQMKEKVRRAAMKDPYDVSKYYYTKGIWQRIARSAWFETLTLVVIALNALWISIETDMNSAEMLFEADPVFQLAEHAFCLYFSVEWVVRFLSFRRKCNCLRDGWFTFDTVLVFIMVVETWLMNLLLCFVGSAGSSALGSASILRIARLLRLSRMARMVRLCKAMPELLILVKAMVSSVRSCFFVFFLLAMMMYIFGIAFRQLTAGTPVGDTAFTSVLQSMHTLWIDGTLLDNPGRIVNGLWAESVIYVLLFYIFVLLSALTLMNMLIGVLCEVVSAVAAVEKESLTVTYVKGKLLDIIEHGGFDDNKDGKISKEELSQLLDVPEACKALSELGVDIYSLIDNIDFIFAVDVDGFGEDGDKKLSFEEFMELILDLRGTNTATVKDIVELRKFITRSNRTLKAELKSSEDRMSKRQLSGRAEHSVICFQPGPAAAVAAAEHLAGPQAGPNLLTPLSVGSQLALRRLSRQSVQSEMSAISEIPAVEPEPALGDDDLVRRLRDEVGADLVHGLQRQLTQSMQETLLPELSAIRSLLGGGPPPKSPKRPGGDLEQGRCASDSRLRQNAWQSNPAGNGAPWAGMVFPDPLPGQLDDASIQIDGI